MSGGGRKLTRLLASTLPQPPVSPSSSSTVRSSLFISKSFPRAARPFSAHSTIPLSVLNSEVTNWLLAICKSLLLGGTRTSTVVLLEASTYMIFCKLFSRKLCTAKKREGIAVMSLRSASLVQSSSTLRLSASVFHAAQTAWTHRSRTFPTRARRASSRRTVDPVSFNRNEASSFAAVPIKTSDFAR